jgi:hypothetical protein
MNWSNSFLFCSVLTVLSSHLIFGIPLMNSVLSRPIWTRSCPTGLTFRAFPWSTSQGTTLPETCSCHKWVKSSFKLVQNQNYDYFSPTFSFLIRVHSKWIRQSLPTLRAGGCRSVIRRKMNAISVLLCPKFGSAVGTIWTSSRWEIHLQRTGFSLTYNQQVIYFYLNL